MCNLQTPWGFKVPSEEKKGLLGGWHSPKKGPYKVSVFIFTSTQGDVK